MPPKPGDSPEPKPKDYFGFKKMKSESEWKKMIEDEAKLLKTISDELKAAGCPIFCGRYCASLPADLRMKAKILEKRLDSLLAGPGTDMYGERACGELRLLIAQGETIVQFAHKMKKYDFPVRCSVVWPSEAIAYRCNTCAYNQCMSLCVSCFKNANHEGHDFNRFFSEAGGACDCGNSDVLSESGFCSHHGPNAQHAIKPSADILSLNEFILPKVFVRLLLAFRGWTSQLKIEHQLANLPKNRIDSPDFEKFASDVVGRVSNLVELLMELVELGGPIRELVSKVLRDRNLYHELNKRTKDDDLNDGDRSPDFSLDWRSRGFLLDDIRSLVAIDTRRECDLICENFLDEFMFWIVRLMFPQELTNICLNLLSDFDFRDDFARRFFTFYPYVSEIIKNLAKLDRGAAIYNISSRIVHISVQILSSPAMCNKLDEDIDLKSHIIRSLYGLMLTFAEKSTITQAAEYFLATQPHSKRDAFTFLVHKVDSNQSLAKACYWTLISDMQNLLTHFKIARRLIRDRDCLNIYAKLISLMQGINPNYRIVRGDHTEYDHSPMYRFAYHLEWEVCSTNMFNIVYALNDEVDCMDTYLREFKSQLENWFDAIKMSQNDLCAQPYIVSFHLPIHRHLAAGLIRSIERPIFSPLLDFIMEDEPFLIKALVHVLRIQAARAEITAGMWLRNGNGIRNQSYFYTQPNYIASLNDCDMMLIKFVASFIRVERFMSALKEAFSIYDCFHMGALESKSERNIQKNLHELILTRVEWIPFMFDGFIKVLLTVVALHWNMVADEVEITKKEIVAVLANAYFMTYSKLRSVIPERGSKHTVSDNVFSSILEKVAVYSQPDRGGQNEQGMYSLSSESWLDLYEPVFSMNRCPTQKELADTLSHAIDAQDAVLEKKTGTRSTERRWIRYRLFPFETSWQGRACRVLVSPSFLEIMHKFLHMNDIDQNLSEFSMQSVIYMLTISVKFIKSRYFGELTDPGYYGWVNYLTITEAFYQTADFNVKNFDSFVLGVFTSIGYLRIGTIPSIVELLMRYLFKINHQRYLNKPLQFVADFNSQMEADLDEMDVISGHSMQYVCRLFAHLCRYDERTREEIKIFLDSIVDLASEKEASAAEAKKPLSPNQRRLAAKRRQELRLISLSYYTSTFD